MGIIEAIIAVAQAIKAAFGFGAKAIEPKEIRIDNHLIEKPKLQQQQKIEIYDREFRRLKDHTEISIPLDINFVDDNLNDEDTGELIKLLTSRITAYRKKNAWARPKFKKWLKENNIQ